MKQTSGMLAAMAGIGGSTSNADRAQRTAPSLGRRNFARVALGALVGRDPDEELNVFETAELWVEPATPRANVCFDGEAAIMEAPLHYRIRPRTLRLAAPEQRVAHRRFPARS